MYKRYMSTNLYLVLWFQDGECLNCIFSVYLKEFEGLGKTAVTICETRRQFSVQPCTIWLVIYFHTILWYRFSVYSFLNAKRFYLLHYSDALRTLSLSIIIYRASDTRILSTIGALYIFMFVFYPISDMRWENTRYTKAWTILE